MDTCIILKGMKEKKPRGFIELPNTADWALQVWAPDLPGLLAEAAAGMYALMQAQVGEGPRQTRTLSLSGVDAEDLLVSWLAELLYLAETEALAFDEFSIRVTGSALEAELSGAPLANLTRMIKAVTYHGLAIRPDEDGLSTSIVFDV